MTPYADKPTIVLGADGFIGRQLVEYWRGQGWPVHGIGRSAGDFTDAETVANAFATAPKAGRIFHAITKQRTGSIQYEIQGELLRDNARIHLNVLDAWRRYQPQAKLVSLGSSCVYPESPRPIPESAFHSGPPHPSVRGYATAKEMLILGSETFGAQYGMKWLHCILATVYGPGAHWEPERSHFMAALLHRAWRARNEGQNELEVWGSLETVRDLLHVHDQIEAVIAADLAFENRVLNCTGNEPVTIGACVGAILAALDWPAKIVSPPGSFQGAGYKTIDSNEFLASTHWRPKLGLRAGVELTYTSMKSEGAQSC